MSNFYNLEMERAVIGTLISDLPDAQGRLLPQLKADLFYSNKHKAVLNAVQTLQKEGRPVNLLNAKELLSGKVDRDYILDIAETLYPVSTAEDFIKTLKNLAHKREIENLYRRLPELNGNLSKEIENLQAIIREEKEEESQRLVNGKELLELLEAEPDENWLLDKVIPYNSLSMIAGRPGVGKSIFTLSLAKAVSEGNSFLERATRRGKVYYFDLENSKAVIKSRLTLLRPDEVVYVPAFFLQKPLTLNDDLLDSLAKEGAVLIFDSFVRTTIGLDQNNVEDMSTVMGRLVELRDRGATVIFIHHRGKSEDNEYMGSTDILAAVDTGLLLDKKDGRLELRTIKHRLGEDFKIPLCLKIEPDCLELRDLTQEIETQRLMKEKEQLKALADVIKDLSTDGQYPNQTEVLEAGKEEMEVGKDAILGLLKKGEGQYWVKVKDPNNSKVRLYKLVVGVP